MRRVVPVYCILIIVVKVVAVHYLNFSLVPSSDSVIVLNAFACIMDFLYLNLEAPGRVLTFIFMTIDHR